VTRNMLLIVGLATMLLCPAYGGAEQFATLPPPVTLQQALDLAEGYIKKRGIDLSKHYLNSVRLTHNKNYKDGRAWIVTWELIVPSDGGQYFITVQMDKSVSHGGGR